MPKSLNTVILDNGAYTVKLGLTNQDDPQIMLNCIMKAKAERRRAFIGNQIEECRDLSGLYYMLCFQKGYLLNWDVQKTVWDYIFSQEGLGISLEECNIIITEPQFNFFSIQEAMIEILFEEYHCAGIHKTTAADLAAFNYNVESPEATMPRLNCLVIDVGYSFCHIVPFINGKKILKGIRRVDVGGKILTNHLKELISYRHLNVMDESYVVNQIKEDVCYIAQDFMKEMQCHTDTEKRSQITVDYILPDFSTINRGYVRNKKNAAQNFLVDDSDQQSVRLCNERFTVPELLFHPSDVGIQQMGIPEAVIDALNGCPTYTHYELLRNILVIGGTSLFTGFIPRLEAEIRSLASDDYEVSITYPKNPIAYAWYGGKVLACSKGFKSLVLTRTEYEEDGYVSCLNAK